MDTYLGTKRSRDQVAVAVDVFGDGDANNEQVAALACQIGRVHIEDMSDTEICVTEPPTKIRKISLDDRAFFQQRFLTMFTLDQTERVLCMRVMCIIKDGCPRYVSVNRNVFDENAHDDPRFICTRDSWCPSCYNKIVTEGLDMKIPKECPACASSSWMNQFLEPVRKKQPSRTKSLSNYTFCFGSDLVF